jgi:membrane fusion protein, type I secretion system
VHVGQTAILRFTAFDQRTRPEIDGTVTIVSADLVQDEKTNE